MGVLSASDMERIEESNKKTVKSMLNSTVGTANEITLDELFRNCIDSEKGSIEYTTVGTHTFQVPSGVSVLKVTACGGGGGGHSSSGCGFGGGGGACVSKTYGVTPNSIITIKIGKGGSYNSATFNPDIENGEATVIGDLVTLHGGKSGRAEISDRRKHGGIGGGDGGNDTSVAAMNGEDGLFGRGGLGFGSTGIKVGCGGGGSYGNGGDGGKVNGSVGMDGVRGGGGGGARNARFGKGGDGYARLEWGGLLR